MFLPSRSTPILLLALFLTVYPSQTNGSVASKAGAHVRKQVLKGTPKESRVVVRQETAEERREARREARRQARIEERRARRKAEREAQLNCPGDCPCEDPGELYGSDTFDESELANFAAGTATVWLAVFWGSSANGIFRNTWDPNLAVYDGTKLSLTVEKRADDVLYAAAMRTHSNWYGYGCFSTCMKPIARSGIISSFFTYVGPWDGQSGTTPNHNEIDIEFEGKDTTKVQFNYYTDRSLGTSQHNEKDHDLGFDASTDFHVYGFRWAPNGIDWEVDGTQVHSVDQTATVAPPVPTEFTTQKVMANVWVVKPNMGPYFGGDFDDTTFTSATAEYKWIRYTKLDEHGCCTLPTSC